MKRPVRACLLAGLVLASLAGTGVASAATLGLSDGSIGAGSATVARCDDVVTAKMAWTGMTKTSVTVSDVAASCAGGTLVVTLTNNGAPVATAGPVTVPVGAGQLVLPLTATTTSVVTDVRVVVVGP